MPQHNYEIIRFKFTTPLHVGNERSDYSTGSALLHSDSIYAAICHAWARLGKVDWIGENGDSGFTISSLFPYVNYNTTYSYFLPRPMLLLDEKNKDDIDTSVRKALKKVQWIDIPVFEALAGATPLAYNNTFYDKGYQSVKELPRDELGQLIAPISNQSMPRAAISRTGMEDTIIYYIDRFYFHERAGLYAFVMFDNDNTKARVEAALRLLADEGLGTDRNVGHGKFEFSLDKISINLPDKAIYGINLGMYCPYDKMEWEQYTEYNMPEARAGCSLTRRGGWMSEPRNTWRKRSVYMALPGGVFKTNGIQKAGTVVNVEPTDEVNTGHPIWRNGQSIFLPCKG
jgi:CRISPR type III-A-associated RAMP protein Csm4